MDDENFKNYFDNQELNKNIFDGKEFELMGKLHIDLANQERALIGGSKVSIKIHFNDPKFYLRWYDNDGKPAEGEKYNPEVTPQALSGSGAHSSAYAHCRKGFVRSS